LIVISNLLKISYIWSRWSETILLFNQMHRKLNSLSGFDYTSGRHYFILYV